EPDRRPLGRGARAGQLRVVRDRPLERGGRPERRLGVGRRQRRRERGPSEPASTTGYTDNEGNVLTLRDSLSEKTLARLRELESPAAASAEDLWQRRTE